MTDYGQWQSCLHDDEPRDQQIDLFNHYWAEIGPDTRQAPDGWSWTVLFFDGADNETEASGFAGDEDAAKQAVQDWADAAEFAAAIDPPAPDPDAPPLPAPGSSDRRVTIIAELNAYARLSPVANIWEDLILGLPEYDEAATVALDPSGSSDCFALTDGTAIRFSAQRGWWEVWL